MNRMHESGRHGVWAGVVMVIVLVSAACAGENLFQIPVTAGGDMPTIEITAPSDGATLGAGSSVQITADVQTPNGLLTADYSGTFIEGSSPAFVAESESFNRPPLATLTNTLSATPGGGVGEVALVVRITDGEGTSVADTVKITVN